MKNDEKQNRKMSIQQKNHVHFRSIQLDDTDGWPDKICIQCVHQVSRCHAFKKRVENSDKELRQYIKGITVIVEEPITQMEIHPAQQHQVLKNDRQEIHITRNITVRLLTSSRSSCSDVILFHNFSCACVCRYSRMIIIMCNRQM